MGVDFVMVEGVGFCISERDFQEALTLFRQCPPTENEETEDKDDADDDGRDLCNLESFGSEGDRDLKLLSQTMYSSIRTIDQVSRISKK